MRSTFKTVGHILIIFTAAAIIIAGLSALTSSTDSAAPIQPPAFDPSSGMEMPAPRPERGEEGVSALGLLEIVKNIVTIGLIVTTYWFGQKWIEQTRRRRRLAH